MTKRDDSQAEAPGERDPRVPKYAGWASDEGDVGLDLDGMRRELEGAIAQERGPAAWLRSRTTPVRALLAGLAIGVAVATTMALWPRADYAIYPYDRMLLLLVTMAGLFAINLVLVVWPLQLAAAPRWLAQVATLGAPLALLGLYALPDAHTHPRSVAPQAFGALLTGSVRCLVVGSVVATAVFALLRGLDRGGPQRQLLMAAGAGLVANMLLQLHCAMTTPAHLIVGHLGVLALSFVFAAFLRRREA